MTDRIEQKVFTEHSLKVIFDADKEHMLLSGLLFLSSPIKACHVASLPSVRQWIFQRLGTNLGMDPSLKSIKGSLYPNAKDGKIS